MKPVVAFARTAPHSLARGASARPRQRQQIRLGYYEHIAAEPLPSISVIQDIDAPIPGSARSGARCRPMSCRARLCRGHHRRLGCVTSTRWRPISSCSPGQSCRATPMSSRRVRRHGPRFGMIVSAGDIISRPPRRGVIPARGGGQDPEAVDLLSRARRSYRSFQAARFSIERRARLPRAGRHPLTIGPERGRPRPHSRSDLESAASSTRGSAGCGRNSVASSARPDKMMNSRFAPVPERPRDGRVRSRSRPMMNEVSIRLIGSAAPGLCAKARMTLGCT